jgi:hypothetical protein
MFYENRYARDHELDAFEAADRCIDDQTDVQYMCSYLIGFRRNRQLKLGE